MADGVVPSGAPLITGPELNAAMHLRMSLSWAPEERAQTGCAAVDLLLAALQQARHACTNWQREAQVEYAKRKAVEDQLAAQDAALQGLEAEIGTRIKATEAYYGKSGDETVRLRKFLEQLASVRAARREVNR